MNFFSAGTESNNPRKLMNMMYKPASIHMDEFNDGFNELLDKVPRRVSHIVMGDFNFNSLDLSSEIGDFLNFMIANDLHPLVNILTKITSQSATFIDNVFVLMKFVQ